MNQEELFKEWVSVPVTSTNGLKGQITVPGPFENVEDLLSEIAEIEASKPYSERIDFKTLIETLGIQIFYGDKITCPTEKVTGAKRVTL